MKFQAGSLTSTSVWPCRDSAVIGTLARGLLLGLALSFGMARAVSAQGAGEDPGIAKARAEWALTKQQLAEKRKLAHSLEQDWARGLWVVHKPLFFSSYKDVDDYLSGRKIPDAAPLTPEYQKKAQDLLEAGRKDRPAVDATALTEHLFTMGVSYNQDPKFVPLKPVDVVCPLYGYPLTLITANPMKWEFAPTKIFQMFTGDTGEARLIKAGVSTYGFKGGFSYPPDTIPDTLGWGFAHWEGSVLMINVSHVAWWYDSESGFVLEIGVPHSEKLTAVEKWRQTGPNTLQVEITLTDPDALTKPWVVEKTYDRVMGDVKYLELRDRQCH